MGGGRDMQFSKETGMSFEVSNLHVFLVAVRGNTVRNVMGLHAKNVYSHYIIWKLIYKFMQFWNSVF